MWIIFLELLHLLGFKCTKETWLFISGIGIHTYVGLFRVIMVRRVIRVISTRVIRVIKVVRTSINNNNKLPATTAFASITAYYPSSDLALL